MNRLARWLVLGCAAALLAGSVLARAQVPVPATPTTPATAATPAIDFARDIQPIFEQYCYQCHGQTTARGRLRLHAPDFIRKADQEAARKELQARVDRLAQELRTVTPEVREAGCTRRQSGAIESGRW